jgi:hypothetical protein
MQKILMAAVGLGLGVGATAAVAQTNLTVRLRGMIEKVDGREARRR